MRQFSQKNRLVLVIDDEEAVREAVTDILEFEGVNVLTAVDGQNGLDVFMTYRSDVDLILLDLSMPGMSGIETFQEIKKIDSEAKIIISTGYDEAEATQRLIGQGSAGFLQKPYNMGHLVKTIREYLD